jgi:hypothetical protein
MPHTTEDAEVVPMLLEQPHVARWQIVATCALRKEVLWNEAEIVTDREHPARLHGAAFLTSKRGLHGLKQWQGKRDAGTAKKAAT